MTLALQLPYWATALLVALFLALSVVMILTVLIQRPMGGGLSGAFGAGSGSGQTAFGAKTGDALTLATIVIFLLWLGFAVGLNFATRPPENPGRAQPAAAAGPEGETQPGEGEEPEGAGEGEGDGVRREDAGSGDAADETFEGSDALDVPGAGDASGAGETGEPGEGSQPESERGEGEAESPPAGPGDGGS